MQRHGTDRSSDKEEVDLEWEVFGPAKNRHYGINILDRNGEIVISDPTDRVLQAVVQPDGAPDSVALHKVWYSLDPLRSLTHLTLGAGLCSLMSEEIKRLS